MAAERLNRDTVARCHESVGLDHLKICHCSDCSRDSSDSNQAAQWNILARSSCSRYNI